MNNDTPNITPEESSRQDAMQPTADSSNIGTAENVLAQTVAPAKARLPWWRRALKITAWVIMAVVLFVFGLVVATLTILRPERLTPIVQQIANNNLNADVTIGRVELSLAKTYPYLNLEIDKLDILSRDTKKLDAEFRDEMGLPEFADSLLTINSIKGGLKVTSLLSDRIELKDVVIDRPQANLVVVNDSVTNFNIFIASEDTTAIDIAGLPELAINNFSITNPQPLRYYDCETGTALNADFKAISLVGSEAPLYKLDFQGEADAPLLMEYFHFGDLRFGLCGNIRWSQKKPYNIGLENFAFQFAMLKGTVTTDVDFTNELIVNKLDLKLDPLSISQVIHILPDEMAEAICEENGIPYTLYTELDTDAALQISTRLLEPFNASTDGMPRFEASVIVPECHLRWQKVDLSSLKADLIIKSPTQNPDDAVLIVNYLDLSGPATNLSIKGTFTHFLTDPTFDCSVETRTQLQSLPAQLKQLFGGALSGELTANASLKGSTSMFTPAGFQRLMVEGDVGLKNFYWLANDTVNMVYVDRASFKFGTQTRFAGAKPGEKPSLSASIAVDSARVLSGNYLMTLKDLAFGIGVQNSQRVDNMAVHPMGGGIKLGSFDFLSISDSAVVNLRDIGGTAIIRPFEGDVHRPEFLFNLGLGRFSAGDNTTRLMVSKAQLDFTAHRKPETERQKRVRLSADSLMRRIPTLTPDSAIAIAESIHRRPSNKKYPRVHPEMVDDSSEIIDFGTSTGLRRILNRWVLEGSLTSNRARMFTPYFPLRNRIRNINIAFNNDTIRLDNVQYKAGRSDITFSGEITNLRRALTSRRGKNPLKIRFRSISDTIDVNQLANTAFTGSAYAANSADHISLAGFEDENKLDSIIGAHVAQAPDSMAPLLIPRNIDLELNCRAKNVLYSDLLLHKMTGSLMAYDGALNLHRLRASSDVGSVNLSALYMGQKVDSLSFGFGMQLDGFNLHKFLDLVPAVDSMMPVLRDFSGIINADIACTTPINRNMDFELGRLNAAIKLSGTELVLLDPDTFKMLSKWLFFKDKKRNIIDEMAVQMSVDNGLMQVYPFIFNIDRYRLGVQGSNDFALNFDYHIAVLKSPMPFKFGINIKGNPDDFKIRLGGAKLNEKTPMQVAFVDTTRVNLIKQIENVFRRGVRGAGMSSLKLDRKPEAANINLNADKLSAADSLELYRQGMIPEPPASMTLPDDKAAKKKNKKSKKNKKNNKPGKDTAMLRPKDTL